jgi:hypothetical protein
MESGVAETALGRDVKIAGFDGDDCRYVTTWLLANSSQSDTSRLLIIYKIHGKDRSYRNLRNDRIFEWDGYWHSPWQ